jgi:hypothetical protein
MSLDRENECRGLKLVFITLFKMFLASLDPARECDTALDASKLTRSLMSLTNHHAKTTGGWTRFGELHRKQQQQPRHLFSVSKTTTPTTNLWLAPLINELL